MKVNRNKLNWRKVNAAGATDWNLTATDAIVDRERYDKISKFCLNRPSQSRLDIMNNFLFGPSKLSMFYVVTMFERGNHLSLIDREKGLHWRRRFNCASSRKVSNYYTIYTGLFCFLQQFHTFAIKKSSKNYIFLYLLRLNFWLCCDKFSIFIGENVKTIS